MADVLDANGISDINGESDIPLSDTETLAVEEVVNQPISDI